MMKIMEFVFAIDDKIKFVMETYQFLKKSKIPIIV